MRHLDLFSGIAGFSRAAEGYGFTTTLFCEIDPACQQVIAHHYPGVPIVSDICDVRGDQIAPADVVTFGSPCQDMSVAGKREGIGGSRSGLFFEAIRIIREMREATNGEYPRYAVWENVPGAFSSNRGQDFRAVLEAIAEAEIPMPVSGKWATSGMVRGDGRSVAWRVLDAQYFGVPQRRKRIYLVADFRGQSAPEILFERQSDDWHSEKSGKKRQETAGTVGDGTTTIDFGRTSDRITIGAKVSATIKASGGGGGESETDLYITQPTIAFIGKNSAKTRSIGESIEVSPTIDSGGSIEIAQCITTGTGRRYDPETETLIAQEEINNADADDKPEHTHYRVRRLTPLEVLRCFGYPDTWLDIAGLSDTSKYRMCGNSIAIPCARFVMAGIAERLDK